jgi:hypothetical protein
VTYADTVLGAAYEALVDPRKGIAAAKRDYWYERYVSKLEEQDIEAVDLELTFPDPGTINPFFYLPRFHVELSPHEPTFDEFGGAGSGSLQRVLRRLLPPGVNVLRPRWMAKVFRVNVYGNKPKSAYENASDLYERWLRDLEGRGFTVYREYEFPRGLRDEIDEADRQPW